MLWGGGHIVRHVWRWIIVPSDLARSFGATAHIIVTMWFTMGLPICVHDLSPRGKGNSRLMKLFGGLSYGEEKKNGGTITHLHIICDGKMAAKQIPLLIPWYQRISMNTSTTLSKCWHLCRRAYDQTGKVYFKQPSKNSKIGKIKKENQQRAHFLQHS